MNLKILMILSLSVSLQAQAGPSCIKEKNPCNPNLLCNFKAEWHSKALLYVIHATNDPSRKGKRAKDGIAFDGGLYNASMTEAKAALPGGTASEIKQRAGQIFEEKSEKFAISTFDMPECELNGKIDDNGRVKDGYQGMSTNEKCEIKVRYNASDYDPSSFGSSDKVCDEFYTRDFSHEIIHQKACQAAKSPSQITKRHEIDNLIKEELKAYQHSMKLSEAYYKFLLAQCSNQFPNQESVREQSKNINQLLRGFDARVSK